MIGPVTDPVEAAYAALGRAEPALALKIIEPLARAPQPPHTVMAAYDQALRANGRLAEAIEVCRAAVRRFPSSVAAAHNLGSALADDMRPAEALEALARAFSLGADAPETWFIQARCHQALLELDRAEHAYGEALKRRPRYVEALQELAHLVWMRTESVEQALAVFDSAPWSPVAAMHKAQLLKSAGEPQAALAAFEETFRRGYRDPVLFVRATQLALDAGDWARGGAYAETAIRARPNDPLALDAWIGAALASGRAQEALEAARVLVGLQPLDQAALAVLATAARAAGSREYDDLYDYDAFVRTSHIEAPAGWASREAFLADLSASLARLHALRTHPVGQSLRHGSQTMQDLRAVDDPVIQAFFKALEPLVRDYMEAVGPGSDPLRSRNTGEYELAGAWSVRLRPSGFHVDHIHPKGWLSSAFYVETPTEAVDAGAHEGWLKFGSPGLPLPETPEPAYRVRPEPGRLALFPSYMWHGTVPFTTDESRLTMAFDIVPRRAQARP